MSGNKVAELYGIRTEGAAGLHWQDVVSREQCPFLGRKCVKSRKSRPEITIGTCVVQFGKKQENVIICPRRFLERKQVFLDCIHLLALHEPGNEIHVVPEVGIPGGNVDYFLVSAQRQKAVDFVGIELQALDTSGTVWPARQRFLQDHGVRVRRQDALSEKTFGMNKKMTAKTTLVQVHHKVETFEGLSKHFVLVLQDVLLAYMRKSFRFGLELSP